MRRFYEAKPGRLDLESGFKNDAPIPRQTPRSSANRVCCTATETRGWFVRTVEPRPGLLVAILNVYESPDTAVTDEAWSEAHPQALALIDALADCFHPRAARLKARLADSRDAEQRALLRAEVLNLLALSFGPDEALRRLQAVQ